MCPKLKLDLLCKEKPLSQDKWSKLVKKDGWEGRKLEHSNEDVSGKPQGVPKRGLTLAIQGLSLTPS